MSTAITGEPNRKGLLHVRPIFFFASGVFLAVVTLPDVVRGSHTLRRICLWSAALLILLGWYFLVKDRTPNSAWRKLIALITSVYLTVSLPVFLFEMSQMKWFMRHPMHHAFALYVRPWVHWGYGGILPVFLGVVGSFFGRGRARVAFLFASTLQMILWAATVTWAA
jgi:hypothetical protein